MTIAGRGRHAISADRRGHRFDADQDMVRAEVYVLGAREPTAQGIAGLLSGAGSRKVALVVAHAGLVKLSGLRCSHGPCTG